MVVEDLDEAAKRAVALGATVIAGPADGPGASVTIADPGGARLALFKPHALGLTPCAREAGAPSRRVPRSSPGMPRAVRQQA